MEMELEFEGFEEIGEDVEDELWDHVEHESGGRSPATRFVLLAPQRPDGGQCGQGNERCPSVLHFWSLLGGVSSVSERDLLSATLARMRSGVSMKLIPQS